MAQPILIMDSSGPAVLELTGILEAKAYLKSTSRTFGRLVRMAVKEFQAQHVDELGRPLVVDGVVGPLTWWALENDREVIAPPLTDYSSMPRSGGSSRGRAALRVAIGEMDARACEIGDNNCGLFVEKYLNGIVEPPESWCAGFVSWCFAQHPEGIPFRYSLGARNIRNQFRRKGWLLQDEEPQPGDLIVWWRDQPDSWKGHIGLVHHHSNGIVYTIEGNKGGFPAHVRGFDYVLSRIDRLLGFGRVPG